jgi:hypothetical protein
MAKKRTSKEIVRICPYCYKDQNTNDNKDQISAPGEFAICIACGGLAIYDERLRLQKANLKEMSSIPNHEQKFFIDMRGYIMSIHHE